MITEPKKTDAMNKRIVISAIYIIAFLCSVTGQNIEAFLREVSSSNPEIRHYKKILEARRVESQTGNNPGPLNLAMGYFPGSPESIGIKRTFEVSQSFEFPTIYMVRKNIKKDALSVADTEYRFAATELLLKARLLAISYIGKQNVLEIMKARLNDYNTLLAGWNTLITEKAVTALDYNRLLTEITVAGSELAAEEAQIALIRQELDYYSGGRSDILAGADYDNPELPGPDELLEQRRAAHPAYILSEKEYTLALREIDLNRAGNLPGLEIGFGSEIVAGDNYSGPRIGISVPLWTNRNNLKLSRADAEATAAGRIAVMEMLDSKTRAEYKYYESMKENLLRMSKELPGRNATDLLATALSEKSITSTEYFAHMQAIYEVRMTFARIESQCMESLSRLLDHKLADF